MIQVFYRTLATNHATFSMGDRDSSGTMDEKTVASNDLGFFHFESPDNNPFGDRPILDLLAIETKKVT